MHAALPLGVNPDKVSVTGSLKFEQIFSQERLRTGQALREHLGKKRLVWLAGSTHAGEEEKLLTLHQNFAPAIHRHY